MNKKLSSKTIFRGRIINLRLDEVELPDGRLAGREIVEHPGAAAIVPIDFEGRVHLVRQYRDAVAQELLEIPAGKLKPGEEPVAGARRELEEELGVVAGKWTHLSTFYSTPGFSDEIMHVFLAEDIKSGDPDVEREEFMEFETRLLDTADEWLGELKDAKSVAGVLLARREMQRRR
jgi:ADP-ribose pyrophosphatase